MANNNQLTEREVKMDSPIYSEYYSHEECDCYKIDLPWTPYKKETKVLCKVSEGYTKARNTAICIVCQCIVEVT